MELLVHIFWAPIEVLRSDGEDSSETEKEIQSLGDFANYFYEL